MSNRNGIDRRIRLVVVAVLMLGASLMTTNQAGAAVTEDTTTSTTPVVKTQQILAQAKAMTTTEKVTAFSLSATTASTERCWEISLTKRLTNWMGSVTMYPKMFVQWCGKGSVISRVLTYTCHNLGGVWRYLGCTKSRGAVGFSNVTILGDWNYYFGPCCGAGWPGGANLTAKFYPGGSVTGTWSWFPA